MDGEDIDLTLISAAEREVECSDKHATQNTPVVDTPTPTSLTATSQLHTLGGAGLLIDLENIRTMSDGDNN